MVGPSLYDILGVDSSASTLEIKRAYRKLALQHHPDKVNSEDRDTSEAKFKEIANAYQVLIDDELRDHYDTYGTTDGTVPASGFQDFGPDFSAFNGSSQNFGPEDFANFFNSMGGDPGARSNGGDTSSNNKYKSHRTEDYSFDVEITLEELYKGKVIKFNSSRNIICTLCNGTGAKTKAKKHECTTCNGKGSIETTKVHPFGFLITVEDDCKACQGKGFKYRPKDKCKKCDGKFIIQQSKVVEFIIERGAPSIGQVVLKKEADEYPDCIPGDLILNYKTKNHANFKRLENNNDLFTKIKIPLVDALCGFKERKIIQQLDGRWLSLGVPAGKVINPGDTIMIPNEGMPISNKRSQSFFSSNQQTYGNMYIGIEIEFPRDNWFIEKNDILKLKTLLDINYSKSDPETTSNGHDTTENGSTNGNIKEESEQVTPVQFSLKSKDSLPSGFGTYFFDVEPKSSHEEPKKNSWFGWW